MSAVPTFVPLLLVILLSMAESETANITAFITQPSRPSYAVEGQNLTLVWTYTLASTVGLARFVIVSSNGTELSIGRRLGPGVITVKPKYQTRFRAQATNTRAELRILTVQRSDEGTYRMNVVPTDLRAELLQAVVVFVNYPPSITEISGNQTVTEGGNVTLNCSADGKPTANTAWTRPSNNSVVTMPLTEIRRQDAGMYRCTAENGIGSPAIGDVWIDIQYPAEATGRGKNATMPEGRETAFFCPVDGNPKPNISWYRGSEVRGRPILSGEKLEARVSGCYTCVASNSLGTSRGITQCLTVTVAESFTAATSPTSATKGPSKTLIGVVTGIAVCMVILIGFVTWWVCKKKKHRMHTENVDQDYMKVDQK